MFTLGFSPLAGFSGFLFFPSSLLNEFCFLAKGVSDLEVLADDLGVEFGESLFAIAREVRVFGVPTVGVFGGILFASTGVFSFSTARLFRQCNSNNFRLK